MFSLLMQDAPRMAQDASDGRLHVYLVGVIVVIVVVAVGAWIRAGINKRP